MTTLGVAIPCYEKHLRFLPRVLASIATQTLLPTMVAVSCSGVYAVELDSLAYPFPLKILTSPKPQNAAQNRNVAARALGDVDALLFFDADDIMHPQRVEAVAQAFQDPGCVLVVHNFAFKSDAEREDLVSRVFEDFEIQKGGVTLGKDCLVAARHIHHGHVSVRRETYNQRPFCEQDQFEDTPFCYRICCALGPSEHATYIATPLSIYDCPVPT